MSNEEVWHQSVAKSVANVELERPYKEPELKHYNFNLSRRWYVIFYAYDPNKGEMARVRLFHPINKFKTVHERLQVANQMMEVIRKDLRAGKTLVKEEVGSNIDKMPSMTMSEAIEFVKTQKENTNHRSNYTRDFAKVISNWESFLLYKHKIQGLSKEETAARLAKVDIPIKAIQKNHIFEFFNYLNQVRKISNKTYNNYKATLSIVFNYLKKRDSKLFVNNPLNAIDVLPVVAKKHAAFTNEQMEQIRKECQACGFEQLLLFIQFMYYTLARPSELLGLRVRYIEIKARRLFIPGELSKTKFDEYVGIPDRLAEIIVSAGILDQPGDNFIFGIDGSVGPVGHSSIRLFYKANNKVLESLGFKKINKGYTLYSYKHSGAISLYQSTRDIALVQRQCRHKELSETSKYLRDLGLIDGFEGVKHWGGAI